jgi:hypothetical protein
MDDVEANQQMGEATENTSQASYCIHIYVTPEGVSVSSEPLTDEVSEAEEQGEPVEGIKGAMMKAMEIYQKGGELTSETDGDDEFAAGYTGGQPVEEFK